MASSSVKLNPNRIKSGTLVAFMNDIERYQLPVNRFILLHDGEHILQWHRSPYRKDVPQLLYSLSQSITSIAVGIAWDQGLLKLDDPIMSFFPDKLPASISPNLARMTIRHLLTMTAGHEDNICSAVAKEQDWAAAFFSQEVVHEPGTRYYNCIYSTYMLSAIIERVTGMSLIDFLVPALFDPLSIQRPVWETCPLGVTAGGMGLSLSTESMAKIGLMLINEGVYEGKRILSEQYIRMATSEQSNNRSSAALDRNDMIQGYGFQFHLCKGGCYLGEGAFGQLCFVAPKEKIVISAASSLTTVQEFQLLLELIYEHFIDRSTEQSLPYKRGGDAELQRLLEQWNYESEWRRPIPDGRPCLDGAVYPLSANPHGLRQICFFEQCGLLEMKMEYGDKRDNTLPFSYVEPIRAFDMFYKDLEMHRQEVVTYAAWLDKNSLLLTLYYIETPYVVRYKLTFSGNELQLQFELNVSHHILNYRSVGVRVKES
ncbi:serine hydrolase domain-containing protein [Paenibacillus xylaniclasticus]|uniref:serine hydrolase domain-containing protein n=1 Tax=Paenibacillus xylaniclasticus TaxID=588083 RepID=UPI000FD87C92|nr:MULTISPECIES: serine hydrolase [Paenibacillus]GFN33917.1 hypothetical protein PCURB6_41770 [Paenibacillus curdlanolyticus]